MSKSLEVDRQKSTARKVNMICLPIPCYRVPAGFGAAMFEPGIVIRSEDGAQVAALRIPEHSRYRGIWSIFGLRYRPRRHDLDVIVNDARVLTLAVTPRLFRRQRLVIADAQGKGCGELTIKTSMMRMPSLHDRVLISGAQGEAVGVVDYKQPATESATCEIEDSARGLSYRTDRPAHAGAPALIRSDNASDIDARLILGMVYYLDFYPQVVPSAFSSAS